MNLLTLIALAFGMSTDAFAAAVVRGTSEAQLAKTTSHTVTPKTALKIGMIFGMTEAITPIVGYFIGKFAHSWVQAFDHWLSFVLLVGIGGHLIYETLMDKREDEGADVETDDNDTPKPPSLAKTILTAIATSIDAMVVGVSLAFLGVNIWLASLLIGIATFIMASVGVFVGAKLGAKVGKIAQIIGGLVLMSIGGFILMTHLASH